jgi:thiamine biosynthesis protein ThiS
MVVVVNGQRRSLGEDASVAALLRDLDLEGKPVAVERNRSLVPKDQFAATILKDGDRVEVVTFVGGG